MSNRRDVPLTGDDLRQIADRLEEITNAVAFDPTGSLPDGDWTWGLSVTIWDEHGSVLGHVKPCGDGWLGFYPVEVSND